MPRLAAELDAETRKALETVARKIHKAKGRLGELEAERDQLIVSARTGGGASARAIAEASGVSHAWVQKLASPS